MSLAVNGAPYLDVRGLNVALASDPSHRILRDVSLAVRPGEVRGLVGESGAGKSMIGKTVFGILPRALSVTSGTVSVRTDAGMRDLVTMPARERRRFVGRRMALIPQDPLTALNPSRRIGAQMTDRLTGIMGVAAKEARERARAGLADVHIRDGNRVLDAYPHELSGGMRQRVLIAEAFAAEPALVVADEPTTALDATVQRRILALIHEMQAEHGTAMLFVTHDLGVVAKLCHTVTVLYGGRVLEEAATADILAAPRTDYARALIEATPRYDRPGETLRPVPAAIIEALDAELQADAT